LVEAIVKFPDRSNFPFTKGKSIVEEIYMKRKTLIQGLAIVLTLITVIFFQSAKANESPAATELTSLVPNLQQGGYVIVFRHGSTNRDQADTDPLNTENIAQQRHLSEKGKEQAKQVGEAFKQLRITFDNVYTSKFHRAIETGKLIGNKEPISSIDITEGGLVVSPIENDRRAEMLRQMVTKMPADKTNTLIVSHKPNIIDAFGKDWFEIKEGESSIFKPDGSTERILVGRFQSSDWIATIERASTN
jgi:phosphohistidine phosphatase SixA